MKQIKTLTTQIVLVSTTGINLSDATELTKQARRNRAKVIEGALSVENELETVILHLFFGTSGAKREIFKSLILDSDWCSFAAKRKLITHIINEEKLLEGPEKSEFEQLMRDVMSSRNAFTHGEFSSDGKRVWLSFFEGVPRKEELTDDYLTRVETRLLTGFDRASQLAVKIGATTVSKTSDGTDSDI
jgi:hypothetical protein